MGTRIDIGTNLRLIGSEQDESFRLEYEKDGKTWVCEDCRIESCEISYGDNGDDMVVEKVKMDFEDLNSSEDFGDVERWIGEVVK